MLITRKSMLSGIERTRDLPVTEEQFTHWNAGMMLQDAFSNLSAGDREFIKTGITDEEWDDLFKNEDESDRQTEHELYQNGWR